MKEETSKVIGYAKNTLESFKGITPTPEICASKLNSLLLLQVLANQVSLDEKLTKIQESLTIIERNVI